MDPFSLTVGIAGILTLAAQTAKVARAFVNSAKHAKDSAKEMLQELDVLRSNLSRLEKFLKTGNQVGQSFDGTSVLVSSTIACRNKLTELYDKLDRVDRNRTMQLKWPLGAKEHQETIGQLRAFAQWVQFALTVVGCALLSKTSTEVLEILGQQLETFHLLGDIGRRAQSIEQSLIDQTRTLRDDRAVREREQVLEWLSTFKHEQKHHDIRIPRVEGTGEWLLQKVVFQQWRDDPKSRDNTLWCHGIQGSGKSVLAYVSSYEWVSPRADVVNDVQIFGRRPPERCLSWPKIRGSAFVFRLSNSGLPINREHDCKLTQTTCHPIAQAPNGDARASPKTQKPATPAKTTRIRASASTYVPKV